MTLRQKICEAGVSTLRELICLEGTGGGVNVIINSEIKKIDIREPTKIKQVDHVIGIKQVNPVQISRVMDNVGIISKTGDEINVVC